MTRRRSTDSTHYQPTLDDVGRKVSRPKRLVFGRPDLKHAEWCARSSGVPGDCSCAKSRTARSMRALRDIAEGRYRCGSKHAEWSADGKRRTWRCTLMIGPAHAGLDHESQGGRRRWSDEKAIAS